MARIQASKGIRKLIIIWISFSLFLMLIILLQTMLGKYGEESGSAWLWFFVNLLPGLVIIFFGYLSNKRVSTLIFSGTDAILYRIVLYLSVAYLVSLTAVMLLQPFGTPENTEIKNLHSADTGLYIFQGLVLIALGIMTYTTQKRLKQLKDEIEKDIFTTEPGIFISYNHADKLIAKKLKDMLEKENIPVTIDSDAMIAGEDIKSFIEKSILRTRTTISIVSNKSLLSGWVGMETVNTFFLQKFSKRRQFIACYIDSDFFDIGFTSNAIQSFDEQLTKINLQIEKHNGQGIDSRDLNDNKSRLISLRSSLDEIIQRLRGSLCVDIRDEKLVENFPLILRSISSE